MIGLDAFEINAGGLAADPNARVAKNKKLDEIINADDLRAAIGVAAEADERIAVLVGKNNAANGRAG